jgi:hypothetical protein
VDAIKVSQHPTNRNEDPMTDARTHLSTASARIDKLAERTATHLAEVEKLRQDRNYSDEYRRRRVQELQAAHKALVRETTAAAHKAFDAAARAAEERLARVEDGQVARRQLAAGRVARVLDGKGPGPALEAFANDADALRQLRAEVPSWVAVNGGDVEGLLLAVDRALRPLASGAEAEAIDVRLRLDDERARLDAEALYAMSPTPTNLMRRAMSTEPMPVMRNGRLERSGAA